MHWTMFSNISGLSPWMPVASTPPVTSHFVKCSLSGQNHSQGTRVSLVAKATFSTTGEGTGHATTALWFSTAQQRRICVPEGPPGACVCLPALPLPALSQPPLPQCTPDLQVFRLPLPASTPSWPPGLSVSCSLSSWPALGEGQIFTALRLTRDRTGVQKPGVSLRVTRVERGQSLVC